MSDMVKDNFNYPSIRKADKASETILCSEYGFCRVDLLYKFR